MKKLYKISVLISQKFALIIGLSGQKNYINNSFPFFLESIEKALVEIRKRKGNVSEQILLLDIGCGKQTIISEEMKSKYGCRLYGMDISEYELNHNSTVDEKIIFDACNSDYEAELQKFIGKFDLIITDMFLEHVVDPKNTHKMINNLLSDSGFIIHKYPTLYDPLILLSYLMPDWLSGKILSILEPFRQISGKFKAYYKDNRGFSNSLQRKYEEYGFEVEESCNFYGTHYCYIFFPMQMLIDIFYLLVLKLKLAIFTSVSCVVLRKRYD